MVKQYNIVNREKYGRCVGISSSYFFNLIFYKYFISLLHFDETLGILIELSSWNGKKQQK